MKWSVSGPSLLLLLSLASLGNAQEPYATCVVRTEAYNNYRKVLAPNYGVHITNECPGSIHTAPWGNWGVSSNVGTKEDGDQFQGWNWDLEWNSCTRDFPPPNCTYYNYMGCSQQSSATGNNFYGAVSQYIPVSCSRFWIGSGWHGGCEEVNGYVTTLNQNFMTLYELDPICCDSVVQSPYFPDITTTLTTCNAWGCTAVGSAWFGPTSYNTPVWPPLLDARIATVVSGSLVDNTPPYGNCNQYLCLPCDPVSGCPPCCRRDDPGCS